MKKLLVLSLAFLLTGFCFAQKVVNDANAESRTISSFHAVEVSGGIDVFITQGNEEALAVSANQKEYVQYIRTEVDKGVLKIWYGEKTNWWPKNRKLKAYISVKNLDGIRGSGASDIKLEGQLSASSMNLHLTGASDLKGAMVISGNLEVHLSGASDLTITGSATDVTIKASGASDVKGYDFKVTNCSVDASGACDVHITVDKELSAKLSGASSVSYKGSAMIKEIKTSGASNISRKS